MHSCSSEHRVRADTHWGLAAHRTPRCSDRADPHALHTTPLRQVHCCCGPHLRLRALLPRARSCSPGHLPPEPALGSSTPHTPRRKDRHHDLGVWTAAWPAGRQRPLGRSPATETPGWLPLCWPLSRSQSPQRLLESRGGRRGRKV